MVTQLSNNLSALQCGTGCEYGLYYVCLPDDGGNLHDRRPMTQGVSAGPFFFPGLKAEVYGRYELEGPRVGCMNV